MAQYRKSYIIARSLEIVIGLYFIAGAIPKGLDIEKFAVQVAAYKVIQTPEMLLTTALFTLFVEIGLGVALVFGLRLRGLTVWVMQAMLLFFTALIVYAWLAHGLEDCGCFPVFKMSPEVSLVKNGMIVAAGIFILWELVWRADRGNIERAAVLRRPRRPFAWGGAKIAVAVALASAATAYAYCGIDWQSFLPHEDSDVSYAQFEIYIPEGYFNLGSGLYLVPVMSASCSECMEKIPEINELWFMPDIPPIIGLCYEDKPGDLDVFKGYAQPMFPIHSLGDRIMLYYALIAEESFRLGLVYNGSLIAFWDGYVPPYEEIMEIVESVYEM
ncbi:MAG TPA: hypothetical protein ENN29_10020 [Candidatus Hydrogenedentes bacterium]|nr:hypothetical protein [Candidatus Hydrogenedentota bacterium]